MGSAPDSYDYANDSACMICGSKEVKQIGGHTFRCSACGSVWCESCTD